VSVDLARVIRPGDGIVLGAACAEPQTLSEALVAQRAAFPDATLFLGVNYSGIVKPEHADHLGLTSYCGAGHNRALADAGVLDIHPHPYSRLGPLIRSRAIRADVVFVQVSPPNAQGEHSLGLAAEVLPTDVDRALSVLADAVLMPAFKTSSFKLERDAQVAALQQDADDGRVDERRLAEVDHERRFGAERRREVGPDARRDIRVGFSAQRDHGDSGVGL